MGFGLWMGMGIKGERSSAKYGKSTGMFGIHQKRKKSKENETRMFGITGDWRGFEVSVSMRWERMRCKGQVKSNRYLAFTLRPRRAGRKGSLRPVPRSYHRQSRPG